MNASGEEGGGRPQSNGRRRTWHGRVSGQKSPSLRQTAGGAEMRTKTLIYTWLDGEIELGTAAPEAAHVPMETRSIRRFPLRSR
jgi:hypothetical protein